MIKNHYFLVFGFVFFALSNTQLNFSAEDEKTSKKTKGDYGLRTPYFTFYRQFIEDMLINHPFVCSVAASTFLGVSLYSQELKKIIEKNKGTVFAAGVAAIAIAYLNKESILKNTIGEDDDEEQEEAISAFGLFSRSGVRIYRPGDIATKFTDVAGLQTAKEDLGDLLMFLKKPKKVKDMGAKIPKGVLLSGSPGNGKTLLAKALAGEVGCAFLYIAASEFEEAIVGVGAARIRHLFSIARRIAPCIIFIDEIDSIGRKRLSQGTGGDNSQTLNQLLSEMDGFEAFDEPVVIIAATNRIDVLDDALLRPGRFDRKIEIGLPYLQDRAKILAVHFKKIKHSPTIDLIKIAQGTQGFSGAELAELVNESAILALRENAAVVTMDHVDQARDYMLLGRETKGMQVDKDESWITAVHEAGHALMHVYLPLATPLYKVTITPRGGALGLTHSIPSKEKYSLTQAEMLAHIQVLLGGSVAEEMIFGHRGAGASNDIEVARKVATSMVMSYGMTEEFKDVSFSEFIQNQVHLPDHIATKLHLAVAKIISESRAVTESVLKKHQNNLLELARMLMDSGTVVGSDVYRLCGVKQPELVYSLKD